MLVSLLARREYDKVLMLMIPNLADELGEKHADARWVEMLDKECM